MATTFAINLSTLYPEWSAVFAYRSESKYEEALVALKRTPITDSASKLYAEVVSTNLRMCVDALKGEVPSEADKSLLVQLAKESATIGIFPVQIEALFLIFDAFPDSKGDVVDSLIQLEERMDAHTMRRWTHRKGIYYISQGKLHEAHDLWSKVVSVIPTGVEEYDDSLCSLLIDLGRLSTELGKYSDAVEIYGQALACARAPHNQAMSLIRLSNALERMSRPAQADKRRMEYFTMIKRDYPTHCSACSVVFGKEPKFLIPCCKTIVHSECLRQAVSDIEPSETECPFCGTKFYISDVVDPNAVEGRKYKKHRRGGALVEHDQSVDA
jgi:tetratricopeptide (TPR) repeat protein